MTEGNKEKNSAELVITALADTFNIATVGFKEFYDESKAASSGNNSMSASSGDESKAASSGSRSKAASSGYYSKAASSGDYSTSASSGSRSTSASSGDESKAASSGSCSTSASSGDNSTSASSGKYSTSASSGNNSTSASSGNNSMSASSGYSSMSASSGYFSTSASSGKYSTSASSGNNSMSASSGYFSMSASSGNNSTSASSGKYSACAAVGYHARVKGDKGNLIMASEYVLKGSSYIPIGGKADIVDGKKIKSGEWYIVENNKWVQVDFTDGVFSYVISSAKNVRKVRTEKGQILFIVKDSNGNYAHGETLREAKNALIYKSTAEFDGSIPKTATGKEWVGIYRAVTGACSAGVRDFVDEVGKELDDNYSAKEIITLTRGRFGAEEFAKRVLVE